MRVLARTRDDDLDTLATAHAVVGVGRGVDPSEYDDLAPLLEALRAELGATRKVTDAGWLPRARQIGITGRSIAPRLFVSIGASGKFNHMVGVRAAGTVLAINPDPDALVFGVADIGIAADWHDAVPLLVAALHERHHASGSVRRNNAVSFDAMYVGRGAAQRSMSSASLCVGAPRGRTLRVANTAGGSRHGSASVPALASSMARHTRSGVHGMSM